MQQLWNEWLHSPQMTTHSSCSLSFLFSAWQRKQASESGTNDKNPIKNLETEIQKKKGLKTNGFLFLFQF